MRSVLLIAGIVLTSCSTFRPVAGPVATPPPTPVIQNALPAYEPRFEAASIEAVPAQAFDNGRMWTFEYPPLAYFQNTYGFTPDDEWLRKARMSSVRIPGCSGSFVSPEGLVMTNHHCAREAITSVAQDGEGQLDDGFIARSRDEERPLPDVWVDQLIDLRDVTADILTGVDESAGLDEQAATIESNTNALIAETLEALGDETKYEVQVISLFNGGRYSLYVYRRYRDVRLVMAPELQLGYFGGDPDNFTYPRFNLDMTFYRVYGDDGLPLNTSETHFTWSRTGAAAEELVFLIGNPGSTTRQQTVAQLLYRGQVGDVLLNRLYRSLIASMQAYYDHDPAEADTRDIRNTIFSLSNGAKLFGGQIEALNDAAFLGRRKDNEDSFRAAIQADKELYLRYDDLFEGLRRIQEEKSETAPMYFAWLAMYPGSPYASVTMQRALFGHMYALYKDQGAPAENLEGLRQQLMSLENLPAYYERRLMIDRLRMLRENLGEDDARVAAAFAGLDEEAMADSMMASIFADPDAFNRWIVGEAAPTEDAAFRLAATFLPSILENQDAHGSLEEQEEQIQTQLGRAWFAVYGTSRPPDATFSLRLSDGVVRGYEYNGTTAPVFTTFYGLYDRSVSHGNTFPWNLPPRWERPTPSLDLGTPLNLVSTNDIIGGNSGSPLVNRNLEVVGLAFDSNIEGMGSNDFIFDTQRARCVSVDVRGMAEALRHVYKADALVKELLP
jgi:hypothetical protein